MPGPSLGQWGLFAAVAFLMGSIPFGLLIARAKGVDIRKVGSGNIGATNVGRVLGKPYFFLCFALDFLKGFVPTLTAGWIAGTLGRLDLPAERSLPWLGVMIAGVLGHVFSPWLKFKGGKGVATAIGAISGVAPALAVPGAAAFVVFFVVLRWKRYMSLASMAAAASLPACVALFFALAPCLGWGDGSNALGRAWPFVGVTALIGVLVVWTHRANLARLRAGTEPKFGAKRA